MALDSPCRSRKQKGFTLLEVMAVLAIIGIAVSVVVYQSFSFSPANALEEQARRFQVVVDMASDYAVLNQRQLGIRIEPKKREYSFMWLDEEQKWQLLDGEKAFAPHSLDEVFKLTLELEDLPWQEEDSLFDDGIFDEELSFDENRVSIGDEEDKPLPPPQILLLSSGDITPFSLIMAYEPDYGNDDPTYFRLNGIDFAPIERQGPLDQL